MATYQDIHRIIKETLQVDAEPGKRWTPQEVKFVNKNNEFYGKFRGVVDATFLSASNTMLSNVDLYNCRIFDKNGVSISLDDVVSSFAEINEGLSDLSSAISSVSSWVRDEVSVSLRTEISAAEGRNFTLISSVSSDVETIKEKIEGGVLVYRGVIEPRCDDDEFKKLI